LGVCQETSREILNMRSTAPKFVPRLLTNDQKQRRVNLCLEIREKANEEPTLTSISRIITGDESWIYGYDPETKQQSSKWKSPKSPRPGRSRVQQRAWSLFFFSMWRGLFTVNSLLPTLRLNLNFTAVLRRLREDVRRKRVELWRNYNWLLHHDNAPAHTSLKTTEFVTNNNMVIVPHPPYSSGLAPVISLCFPN
jgi:hypothetical protein